MPSINESSTGSPDGRGFSATIEVTGDISDTTGAGSLAVRLFLNSRGNDFSRITTSVQGLETTSSPNVSVFSTNNQRAISKNSTVLFGQGSFSVSSRTGSRSLRFVGIINSPGSETFTPKNVRIEVSFTLPAPTPAPSTGTVPNVLGQTSVAAQLAITNAGFTGSGSTTTTGATSANNGKVSTQNPAGGTTRNLGTSVSYVVFNFVVPQFSVSFNANGGNSTPTSRTANQNTNVTLPTSAGTNSGFYFAGWNTNSRGTGTSYSSGANYNVGTANSTLFAVWRQLPGTPQNVQIDETGIFSLRLNWSDSSGTVSGYYLYLNGSLLTQTSSSVYTFNNLSPNTGYTLGVAAYNNDGFVSSRVSVNGTTAPATFRTPNVLGQTNSLARTNLLNAGFGSVNETLIESGATRQNNRLVRQQAPASGVIATGGDTAAIEVYNYQRIVPNILGQTKVQGETSLQASEFFDFTSTTTLSGATLQNNRLIGTQSPTGGTSLNIVNRVTFIIFEYRIPIPNVVGLDRANALSTLTTAGFSNVTITTTETGATEANNGKVISQSPINSGTRYNPLDQSVSILTYSLGIVGKRMTGANTSELLTTSARFDGTEWIRTLIAKRFNGTSWVDIS